MSEMSEPAEIIDQEPEMPYYCIHCGESTDYPLPVEPVYFLEDTYRMIPFPNYAALKQYLHQHKDEFPPRYIRTYPKNVAGARYRRVITAKEVKELRKRRYTTKRGK